MSVRACCADTTASSLQTVLGISFIKVFPLGLLFCPPHSSSLLHRNIRDLGWTSCTIDWGCRHCKILCETIYWIPEASNLAVVSLGTMCQCCQCQLVMFLKRHWNVCVAFVHSFVLFMWLFVANGKVSTLLRNKDILWVPSYMTAHTVLAWYRWFLTVKPLSSTNLSYSTIYVTSLCMFVPSFLCIWQMISG